MWCFAPTSHTGAWARPTSTRNRPWVTVVLARYSSARSCLRCPAEQSITRNAVRFGIAANTAAEPAGQPHQVSVFERLIGARQRPPPYTEPARIMAHAEVCVQHNAIDAIVAAAQQILIESAQPVRHGGSLQVPCRSFQTAPQGPLFRSPVCEKA